MPRKSVGRAQPLRPSQQEWDHVRVRVTVRGPDTFHVYTVDLADHEEYEALLDALRGLKPWVGAYAAFSNHESCRIVAVVAADPAKVAHVQARRGE